MSRVLASEGGMHVQAMKAIAQSAHKMEALHLEVKVRRSKPLPANALSQAVVCGRVATVLTSVAVGSTGRTEDLEVRQTSDVKTEAEMKGLRRWEMNNQSQ